VSRRIKGVIAIDGPAGVGKSSVGIGVAKELKYRFITTGEMYRALAWKALQDGVDLADNRALGRLARRIDWEFRVNGDGVILRTYVDGIGVAGKIHTETVGMGASKVSAVPGVRKVLRALQRALGEAGGVVMEGRDITTVVFPDADLKVYLDASPRARARRRTRQLRARGKAADESGILAAIIERDKQDSGRRIDPLRKADDAVVVDTTELSKAEVVEKIVSLFRRGSRRRAAGRCRS